MFKHFRDVLSLASLSSCSSEEVVRHVVTAHSLSDATPLSLLGALPEEHDADGRLSQAMCVVAPAELLHHVYHRPSRDWKLVCVDARMRTSTLSLPVCVRLEQIAHTQRRQILRDMPYEDCVHVCLMGDGPPVPGDDAFELYRHLLGSKARRRHVSIVAGGWEVVQELAVSLKLHLVAADDLIIPDATIADTAGRVADATSDTLDELKAGAARHVAKATEKATAVGQQASAVGQKLGRNFMKGWSRLLGDVDASAPPSSPSALPAADPALASPPASPAASAQVPPSSPSALPEADPALASPPAAPASPAASAQGS